MMLSTNSEPRGHATTSEEEDLLDRSTKKPKPNAMDCNQAIMDDVIIEECEGKDQSSDDQGKDQSNGDQRKPSYRESDSMAAVEPVTTEEGNRDQHISTERLHDVGGNIAQHVEEELTTKTPSFGPWMIAKYPHPRKNAPKNLGRDSSNQLDAPSGSRFAILQNNELPTSSTTEPAPVLEPRGFIPKIKVGRNSIPKPKQNKNNTPKPFIRQNKSQSDKSKTQQRALISSSSPRTVPAPDKEIMREKEAEILRFLSWKQKELWNSYVAEKSSSEFLNQFVHNPSEEEMAFVNYMQAKGQSSNKSQSDPPDRAPSSCGKVDDGIIPQCGQAIGVASNTDGTAASNA
ncbi:hypothetical protein RIF29_22455 [Crotalaria pallida]|uniref:Uncharacterized protein n=1 Tax=Crotalaria pallida TaxID=3830 RepID=A0AAN9F6D2_CROPI